MSGFRIARAIHPDPTPPSRPAKKPAYITFIKKLPCCISGENVVEAAHVNFADTWHGCYGRGKGTKVPDRFCLPLSLSLHRLQHSCKLGSEQDFWKHYGIVPHELANTLFGIWSDYSEHEAVIRATSRINSGLALAGRLPNREEI